MSNYDEPTRKHSVPLRLIIIIFHLVSLCTSALSTPASTPVNNETEADRHALLCLKSQLHDPSGALASWTNESSTFCSWHGVTCTRRYAPRVAALDLESQNISGQIFPCIADLSFLTRIHMPDNQLNGHISPEIGRLTQLRYLNLSMNSLSGVIPDTISSCSRLENISLFRNSVGGEIPLGLARCSFLQEIILSNNNFQGSIPSQFGLLPNLYALFIPNNQIAGTIPQYLGISSKSLVYVNFQNNSLSGEIPPALFNSTSISYINLSQNNLSGCVPTSTEISSQLRHLDLTDNNLSGVIPDSVGNLSSLSLLFIAQNNLQGSIPESLSRIAGLQLLDLTYNNLSSIVPPALYTMSSLTYLGLGINQFAGRIPTNIGYNLTSIETLILQGNQLEGPIPTSFANASNLRYLNLRSNEFTGVIPGLGFLSKLTYLDLGRNMLEAEDWSFLSSLTHCSQLQELWLDTNRLQGIMPSSVTNLSESLEILFLSENEISGVIPLEIGKLVGLTVLQIDTNLLYGHIPETIGNLQNLSILSLSHNRLSGEIPQSFGKLEQLTGLYLEENNLTGQIPIRLAGCGHLMLLNLSCNNIQGNIPHELFSIISLSKGLDLSYNQFTGPIPPEIGRLINLETLNISNNQLSGEIPSTLGECVSLGSLHLEANFLQGGIPESLSNLRGISEMDLSQNNLSSQIPDFFENFSSLQSLNLSFNDLEGEIPSGGVFNNSSVVLIQGNRRLCASSPMLQVPLCVVSPSKRKISNIFAIVVPLTIIALVTMACVTTILLKKRKETKEDMNTSLKEFKSYSYNDIFHATDGFSPATLVGLGRFGLVYRGQFMFEAHRVAIKVFRLDQFGAPKNFLTECEALRNIRHRNLIRVISVCSTFDRMGNEFKALILDYMANGNLENWIHPKAHEQSPKRPLSLGSRINIAVDIAAALEYLHNQCTPPLAHCDLKPSNILLDDEMVASLSDFGLAKFLNNVSSTELNNSSSILGPEGSVGYIAPEYGLGCKISTEGDVYSYGIILLEMIIGRCPTDDIFVDGMNLHSLVKSGLKKNFCEMVDPYLTKYNEGEDTSHTMVEIHGCAIQLAKLGLKCSSTSPRDRPTMEDVYAEIISIDKYFSALQK